LMIAKFTNFLVTPAAGRKLPMGSEHEERGLDKTSMNSCILLFFFV